MPPLEVQILDIGAQALGDPQTVERQQRRQGVVPGRSDAGLHQERPEFVAIQAQGARLVINFHPNRRLHLIPTVRS
ncbi:MAG: hypothetical protein QOE57_1505 [Acidimicrobiaceae bacterium]|nr:hypothetical protein [Acidimicrobiaceae bacterium]